MDELERIRARKMKELVGRSKERPGDNPLAEPFDITDGSFDEQLSKHELLFVDFWAPWCGPCKMVAPIVRQLAREYAGKVAFGKLNTDENPKTSMKFRVMSIPTLMLFRQGKPVDIIVGAAPRPKVEAMIRKHLT